MIYDFVIFGGGIAGLYTAYKLHLQFPDKKILLLEKEKRLGGRVETYRDKHMTVEAGAGRFSNKHHRLMKLIREFGLQSKVIEISSEMGYVDSGDKNHVVSESPVNPLMAKIISASKTEPVDKLRAISFVDFANTVLGGKDTQLLLDSFGYYSELVIMNTYDSIRLIGKLTSQNRFYVLGGGLEQLIGRFIECMGENDLVKLYTHKTVCAIQHMDYHQVFQIHVSENVRPYLARVCISALPKQVMEGIEYFHPIRPLLKQIVCAPLCRIYSKFPKGADGKVWFSGLSKIATNNNLRMIIPISEEDGTIMISYTDNKFANYWQRVYRDEGVVGVNRRLKKYIKQSLGIVIPEPISTVVFYWSCGVGYWGVGSDSELVSREIVQPFGRSVPMFVCGEHVSANHQQWIEGALETSDAVIDKMV